MSLMRLPYSNAPGFTARSAAGGLSRGGSSGATALASGQDPSEGIHEA